MRQKTFGINYGGGYDECHKFMFSTLESAKINHKRSEAILSKLTSTLKSEGEQVADSLLLTADSLKRQKTTIEKVIEDIENKFETMREKISVIE